MEKETDCRDSTLEDEFAAIELPRKLWVKILLAVGLPLHIALVFGWEFFIPSWQPVIALLILILFPVVIYAIVHVWWPNNRARLATMIGAILSLVLLDTMAAVLFFIPFPPPSYFRHYHYRETGESLYVYKREAEFIQLFKDDAEYTVKRQIVPLPIMVTQLSTGVSPYWIPQEVEAYLEEKRRKHGTPIAMYRPVMQFTPPAQILQPPTTEEPVRWQISQNNCGEIPKWQGIKICINDVTKKQVCLTLITQEDALILGPTSIKTGDRLQFSVAEKRYELAVEIIDNWDDNDYGVFEISEVKEQH